MNSDEHDEHDEHDDLWRLLGKAREPRVSPFFARNVVRSIREESAPAAGWWTWLRARWQVAAIGVAAVAVVCAVSLERAAQPDPVFVLASRVSASPDLLVISQLDELLDSEQNSVWLDASPY